MKDFACCERLMARTPLFSSSQYNQRQWAQFLRNADFQLAVYLASPSFYHELSKKEFRYENLNEKQQRTVRKYVNRASFRSVPFGHFSSCAVLSWDDGNVSTPVLSQPYPRISWDLPTLYAVDKAHLRPIEKEMHYRINTTLFDSGFEYRFMRAEIRDQYETVFNQLALGKTYVLNKLLANAASARTFQDLLIDLMTYAEVGEDEAASYLEMLIHMQVLVSVTGLAITTKDLQQVCPVETSCGQTSILEYHPVPVE